MTKTAALAYMYPGFTVAMQCCNSGTNDTGLHTDTLDLHCQGNAILPVATSLACIHVSWIFGSNDTGCTCT